MDGNSLIGKLGPKNKTHLYFIFLMSCGVIPFWQEIIVTLFTPPNIKVIRGFHQKLIKESLLLFRNESNLGTG